MLRKVRKNYKRLVAFLLSAAMIITNVGGNAGTVFAAEGQEERESAIFMVDGQEILEAIQGLKDQVAFSKEDLEEMGLDASRKGVLKKYEKLLLPEEGKVYELALNINTELALEGTALQVFYNGKTKEVIFLYMNESGQSVDCYVNIDGYETKVVTVEANDANVTAGVQETTAGEETGEEPGNGSGGGSGSSGGGSGSTGGSGGSGNGGSGSGSSGASDGQSAEDGTSGEATEGSKEEASSADEGNGSEEDADKASEEETKAEAPKEESKADETGSAKEESKSEADGDGKEQPEKGTDGKDDKDEKESADSDKAENGGEEADKKETESAKPEGSGQDKGTSDKDGSQKPSDADSGKDTDKAEGDAGKEDDSADKAGDQGSKDDKEDAADKGSDDAKGDSADKADGSDSKEDSADKADGSDSKEDSADKADGSDSKEDSADKADSSDSKEDSADKADDSGSKGDSADKADGGSDDASSSKDEDKSSGSGDSGSDGAGADSSNDGGSSDRHDGNRLSLSMSRHQAGIVAIQLDEIQDEGEAEEETTTVEETEEETEEETTTVKETEEETEKETKAEAVKEETEGNVAEEETTEKATEKETEAETTEEAAEKETEAETTEKADKEETAKEESKAEETEKGTETAAETKETEKETVKAEESTEPEMDSEQGAEATGEGQEESKETQSQEEAETTVSEESADKTADESKEESSKAEDESKAEGSDQGGADNSQSNGEELSDDWEIPGKVYETVTIQETINARAYCVELQYVQKIVEATKGEEIPETISTGFSVDYMINLEDAAQIKGADSVEEGENLYFAVEPKNGYEIIEVLVNGEWLEAVEDLDSLVRETAPEWRGYSYVYYVENVTEDLEVIVNLEELVPVIPSKVYTSETDDALFSVNVPDGAFEEEVELRVAKIVDKQHLEELSDQANSAIKTEKAIAGIMAYDVTFVSAETGNEVEPSKAVEVSIRLKKSAVPEDVEETDVTGISVVHLPENDKAEVVASAEDVKEKEFEFQTDGFSIYVIAAEKAASVELDGKSYSTITEAINSITDQENETIVLLEDISENVVSNGKSYTLNLNGMKLTSKAAGKSAYTINGGKVTIQDGTITGTKKSGSVNISGIRSVNADVALKNCVIEKNAGYSYGGGIYAEGGSFTLEDCKVTENKANYGAGIYALNCKVGIRGNSKVNGNTGSYSNSAGGLYIKGGSLVTENGQEGSTERTIEISNNNSTSTTTNGIYLLDCAVQIKDAKISANGFHGIEIKNTKAENNIVFENAEFSGHSVVNALYVNNVGETVLTNCDISGNHLVSSQKTMAPVYFMVGGAKTLTGCTFSGNSATSTYGGTYASNVKTRDTCGGLYIAGKGDVAVDGCTFIGNEGRIGALITKSAVTTIKGGSVFAENVGTAVYSGTYASGAIRAQSGTVTISGAVIKNNSVITTYKNSAGGIDVAGGTFKMNADTGDVAVYNNLYNDEPRDLYLNTGFSSITILPADKMRDPADSKLKWGAWNDGNQDVTETVTHDTKSKTGVWKAVEKAMSEVVQIGEMKFETLSQAIKAAQAGDVITLIEESAPVSQTLEINKAIVIDLNNHKIEPDANMDTIMKPLISVKSGGSLTLSGEGTIGHWIEIADVKERNSGKEGSLYLEGNIRIESLSSHEVPIESYGTVVVKKDIDNLMINSYKGKVEVAEDVHIGKLDILQTVGFKKIYPKNLVINGYVENLILTQKRTQKADTAEAVLNGRIGTLTLKHEGCSNGLPNTYAGENFSAEAIQLTPSLGYTNPAYDILLDPKKEADDIIMIQGSEGHFIQADEVNNLENVVWKKPADATGNDNFLRFLVRPAIDEKGNLVLRKSVSAGIYLDGEKGNDEENSGLAADDAVKSFERAKELLSQTEYDTIYVVGAVTVNASDAEWTFEDLAGNEGSSKQYKVQRYLKYFGPLVIVPNGAELTLRDIIIDGGGNELNTKDASVTAPLVMNNGKLTVTNGAVLRNNHNTYQDISYEGGAVRNAGMLEMTGGVIEANSAVSGGGVFNRGTFTFSGGEIKNNAGQGKHRSSGTLDKNGNYKKEIFNAGGGVFIANSGKMTMSGDAVISGNTAKIGGGISLGNNHNVYIGSTFTMVGGTIDGNEAEKEGGGIFIQENCSAKVTKGNITNNKSHGGAFGGVGVYVNGGTGLGKNGLLELENVKISNNEASGKGGGVAACPSANVKIYLDDGGLIKYNQGSGKEFDIYSTNIGYNKYSSKGIYLSRYMKGGASYDWTNVEDKPTNEFCVYSASEKVSVTDDELPVKITGNTADTNGGGIGTNGDVIIGKDNPDLIEVSVSKEWKYDQDGEVVSGIENLKPINAAIGSVTFQLQERKKLKDGEQDNGQGWKDVVYGGKASSVPDGEKWSTITFLNLRKVDSDGDAVEYRVVELTDDGYILVDTKHETDEITGNSSWTFINMPTYSLKLMKRVEDNYNKYTPDKKFTFEITLKKADATPYNGMISAVKGMVSSNEDMSQTEEAVDVVFTDGRASVELGKDEYIHLKQLTAGMEYSVTETEESGYETRVNGKITNTAEGTIQIGVNQVECLNKVEEPRGKLKIRKIVEDGDLEKDWHFSIELQDRDGKPLDTIGKVYTFTYFEGPEEKEIASAREPIQNGKVDIVLKHNQSVEIDSLPEGTNYIVKEKEANQGNYSTTVVGTVEAASDSAEGKIAENEIAEVVFKNKLNTGSLEISKKVAVLGGDLTDRNKNDVFTFDVELTKPEGTDGDLRNILHEFGVVEGIEGAAVPADDAFVVTEPGKDSLKLKLTLKHGQKVILTNLPAGTIYTVNENDAGESGYTVVKDSFTGVIEKEETAEAAFTNTVLTSGLMISKAVLGDSLTEANRNTEFTFEVELRDRDGSILTGRYPYTGSKEGTITSGETVTLKDGEWISIQNLPEKAQYTVWEKTTNTSGYTASVSGEGCSSVEGFGDKLIGGEGTLVGDGGSAVQFTNTVKVGSLEIKKTVSGIEPVEGRKFPFTLTVDNPAVNGEHGDVTFVNGVAEFELADNESVLVDRLPEGVHYTIEEGQHDGYSSNAPNNASGIIEGETIIPVSFINVVDTGELSVQKTVTGKAGEREKEFTFTIALTYKGNPLAGTYPYTGSTVAEGVSAPQGGNMTFDARGEARITLKHGQKITVSGLPVDAEYKVTEAEANRGGYTTVVTDSVGIIVKDEEKTVKFVNNKPETPEETTPTEPTTPEETTPTEPTTPEETSPSEEPTTPEETSPSEEPTTPEETTPTEPTTPEETPENPTTPSRPSGGGGGGGGRDRDRNPSLTPEPTPIPPEEVPLANIDPEDVPLAMMPSESPAEAMVIDDEGVPLFGLPRTGDRGVATGALIGMMLLSLMAACGIHVKKRKEEE